MWQPNSADFHDLLLTLFHFDTNYTGGTLNPCTVSSPLRQTPTAPIVSSARGKEKTATWLPVTSGREVLLERRAVVTGDATG